MNTIASLEQLYEIEQILLKEYNDSMYPLRQQFAIDNARFNVGDFVFNVTGIIKVDKIGFRLIGCTSSSLEITYTGLRYKKEGDILSRTKDEKPSTLIHHLKLIDNPITNE